ncbi:MAG: hypothetical protein QOG46_2190 [Pseudonocardiales bacterium]|nr:hypothetical protein [Pseudonocardiales bacterium]
MEQDRTPIVLPDHHELARPTAETHQIIIDLINSTTTTTGLTVHCVLDTAQYPTGINYTNKDVDALPITRHDFHGEWNYTLGPPDTP